MALDPLRANLVWITKRYAINPANVVCVFHGNSGQFEITLVAGQSINTTEKELTPEARAFFVRDAQPDYTEPLFGHSCSERGE